jgi:hypothetical protein
MFSARQILLIQKINALLPHVERKNSSAVLCSHCTYINENEFSFCTNCGYPLQNKLLTDAFNKRIQQRNNLLFKAENAVMVARIVLYVMGSFLSMGVFFIFAESSRKYLVVMMALLLSGLFFFLALWSRKNPFTALLTAFIILISFSAINIFGRLVQSFTTLTGMTGMLLCLALLLVVLKGVQGAYRINLIKEELQIRL